MSAQDTTPNTTKQKILVCNCERTMDIDGKKLASALGRSDELHIHTNLCRQEVETYGASLKQAAETGDQILLACTQEAPLFTELAEENNLPVPTFTNIRERAGWCAKSSSSTAKMAALLKDATFETEPAGLFPVTSSGTCLVYGAGQTALDTASKLAETLSVSLILTDAADVLPPTTSKVPIYEGKIASLSGSLGAFEMVVNGYAPALPSSRDALQFMMPRDGAKSKCDIVVDLSGGDALVTDPERRDGYFHVDPARPAALAETILEAADLIGEFEKPIYVQYDADICAHSRNQQVGCNKCVDACPTGAITPDGDNVAIAATICGGCGSCASLCPSGAISYRYPQANDIVARTQAMIKTYLEAGGQDPAILFHNQTDGAELIAALARFGKGLPVNVLPINLYAATQLGHETLAACVAAGAQHLIVLASSRQEHDLPAVRTEVDLTNAILKGLGHNASRIQVLETSDPDELESALYDLKPDATPALSFTAVGKKRELARSVITKLNDASPAPQTEILLPAQAPYGRIAINTEGCTLCLACVSCCPANALSDNPDKPQINFTEAACVQCGLCTKTCPESVITLEPRFNLSPDAMTPATLNEEEPFECIRCSKPFGSKSSIEAVSEKLSGKHSMFQSEDRIKLIKMCDDCRILAVAEETDQPMAMGERPVLRTTDDYLKAEAQAKATGKKPEDFLS